MLLFQAIRSHFSLAQTFPEYIVSWIFRGILILLLIEGNPHESYCDEPEETPLLSTPEVTEIEQISPDYTLERSEQRFIRYSGKRIVSIRIKRLEVFDASVNDTTEVKISRLEKLLNNVNFNTRETTIQQNLLFNEGDIIDPYALADSERLLRRLNFIKDARIVVIPDKKDNGIASIVVIVKDQWSFIASGSPKQGSGFKVSLREGNLFGYGHQVSGTLTNIPHTRPEFGVEYSVQNIRGSFITGNLNYIKMPNNNKFGLEFTRELVSPVLKYSGGLEFSRNSTIIKNSLPFFTDNDYNLVGFWAGKTIRFAPMKREIDRRRSLVISGRFRHVTYTKHPDITDTTWYRYHDKSYYLGNIAFLQHRYYKTNLLYNYGRTENIPYGLLANLTSGMVDDNYRSRLYVSTSLGAGNRIERLGYGAGKLSISGCPSGGTLDLGILKLQTLYFSDLMNLGEFRFRQFLKTEFITGINRYSDDSIDFTAENTIRGVGYNHRVTGVKRLFISLDTVMLTPWKIHGFTFALFTFADVDFIASQYKKIFTQDYYSGLGLGVRIHSETFGIETVQIRFAWYPNLPLEHNSYSFTTSGEKRISPIDFVGSKPEIIEY